MNGAKNMVNDFRTISSGNRTIHSDCYENRSIQSENRTSLSENRAICPKIGLIGPKNLGVILIYN